MTDYDSVTQYNHMPKLRTAAMNNTNLRGFCRLYGHDYTSAGICQRCNQQA